MSRRPKLKLVTEDRTDSEMPDFKEAASTHDPRALTRPDWIALILAALALVLTPLLSGSFSTLALRELEFTGSLLDTFKLLGLPLLFLLTGAALGITLWREWKRPVAIGLVPGMVASFGLLGLWATLTLLHTRALYLSLNALTALFAALMLGGLLSRLARERTAIQALLITLAGAGSLVALFGVWEYWEARQRLDVLHRINGTFNDPNFLAGYLLLTLPLTLALFVAAKHRVLKVCLGAGLLLQSAALLLTGSRAGVGVLVVGLLGWLILAVFSGAARGHWRQIALGLAVFVVGAVLGIAPLRSRVDVPTTSGAGAAGTTAKVQSEDQSHSSEFRRWTWIGTVRMGMANPLIGTGIDSFEIAYPRYAETAFTAHAHNSYLQWMGETGIPGLLFLLIGMAAVTAFAVNILLLRRRSANNADFDDGELEEREKSSLFGEPRLILSGLLASLLASLLHNFIDSDWYIVAILVTFAGVLAMTVAVARDIAPLATQIPRPLGRPFFALGAVLALLLIWRGIATENAQLAFAGALADMAEAEQHGTPEPLQKARSSFLATAAAMPFDPRPHLQLSNLALDPADRLQELQTAARLVPSGEPLYLLSKFYVGQKQWDAATEVLEQARDLDPHNTQILRALGNAYLGANKKDQAIEVFQAITALEDKPYGKVRAIPQIVDVDFAFAHTALAENAAQAGRWSEAEAEYAKADKVLREYWNGRHWDINLQFFPPAKRKETAQLYDDVFTRWQESLNRQGKAKEAAEVSARQMQFRKERDEDKVARSSTGKALEDAPVEGGAGT